MTLVIVILNFHISDILMIVVSICGDPISPSFSDIFYLILYLLLEVAIAAANGTHSAEINLTTVICQSNRLFLWFRCYCGRNNPATLHHPILIRKPSSWFGCHYS